MGVGPGVGPGLGPGVEPPVLILILVKFRSLPEHACAEQRLLMVSWQREGFRERPGPPVALQSLSVPTLVGHALRPRGARDARAQLHNTYMPM